jgi:hypothetical protein
VLGAVRAAEDLAGSLDTMANHRTVAMSASWSQGVNRAFEAVEGHSFGTLTYLEGLVVVVSTNIASRHGELL